MNRVDSRRFWVALALVSVLLAGGCRAQPVAVVVEPNTPPAAAPVTVQLDPTPVLPTPTRAPTLTPSPTATASAVPTATSTPTSTPTPTVTPTPSPMVTKAPRTVRETDNILVLGIDMRPGEGAWRTDTIMVLAIDYEANQVGIVSIPRDLWIEIPDYGMGRINQADFLGEHQKYPGGGPALAGKLIEDNLGIPTHHFIRIKMEGLVQLVDALGGVTVTLDCPLHEITPDPANPDAYEHFDLPAGEVELDGLAAKKFATYRYATNDFSRSRRQQQLIWAIRERALQVNAIPKIPALWQALAKTFTTDLSVVDVIRLARLGATLEATQVHGLVFSTDAIGYAVVGGGAQVLLVQDPLKVEEELSKLFAGPSISQQGRDGSGVCPTPVPLPAVSPTVTLSPVMTPTLTPAPG